MGDVISDQIETKVEKLFLTLDNFFGPTFYKTINYYVKLRTEYDLPKSIIEKPKKTFEALTLLFGQEAVEGILVSSMLRSCISDREEMRSLIELCKRDDKEGIATFFDKLKILR